MELVFICASTILYFALFNHTFLKLLNNSISTHYNIKNFQFSISAFIASVLLFILNSFNLFPFTDIINTHIIVFQIFSILIILKTLLTKVVQETKLKIVNSENKIITKIFPFVYWYFFAVVLLNILDFNLILFLSLALSISLSYYFSVNSLKSIVYLSGKLTNKLKTDKLDSIEVIEDNQLNINQIQYPVIDLVNLQEENQGIPSIITYHESSKIEQDIFLNNNINAILVKKAAEIVKQAILKNSCVESDVYVTCNSFNPTDYSIKLIYFVKESHQKESVKLKNDIQILRRLNENNFRIAFPSKVFHPKVFLN